MNTILFSLTEIKKQAVVRYGYNGSFRRHVITSNPRMWQLYLIILAFQLYNFLVVSIVSQIYSFGAFWVSAACTESE